MCRLLLRLVFVLTFYATSNATSSSCAHGQHMICKTVEETFSGGCEGTTTGDQQVFRSRIGKAGPKGDKGQPAEVNKTTLDGLVEERVNIATVELQMAIQKLERDVHLLNATILSNTAPVECRDGFPYDQKCYTFVTSEQRDVTLNKARLMCQERGEKLAYVVNSKHQYLLDEEMRKKIKAGMEWTQIWLDIKYAPTTRTLHFGEGEWALASSFRWYYSYPDGSSATTVAMESRRDPYNQYVGFFNHGPGHVGYGALCTT